MADAGEVISIAPPPRAIGELTVAVGSGGAAHRLARYRAAGSLKALFPAARRRAGSGAPVEAVTLNTAGGLTGGDIFTMRFEAGAGAALTVTTQSAERVYRSIEGAAQVTARLSLGAGAQLCWLPQETILFDGARLKRRLEIDMAPDATLVVAEAVIFGRRAMGETVSRGFFSDFWRVRRADRLIFADATRLASPIDAVLSGPATGGGAAALATLLVVGPALEPLRDHIRAALAAADGVRGGASITGQALVCRLVCTEAAPLRRRLADLIGRATGAPPPSVWRI